MRYFEYFCLQGYKPNLVRLSVKYTIVRCLLPHMLHDIPSVFNNDNADAIKKSYGIHNPRAHCMFGNHSGKRVTKD